MPGLPYREGRGTGRYTRDEAMILTVESNLQRSIILPSEKAFSYKMRLEAMKRQAGRPSQNNSSPVGIDLRGKQSLDVLGEEVGDSRNQIHRYIRLTELIPELLDLVDEGRIAFRPAVELSYLQKRSRVPCWSKSLTQMPRHPLPRPLS